MNKRKFTKDEITAGKKLLRKYFSAEALRLEDVAIRVNEKHPQASASGRNLTQKINNGTLRYLEFLEIIDAIGYDLKLVRK